jgi:hypothetical protein
MMSINSQMAITHYLRYFKGTSLLILEYKTMNASSQVKMILLETITNDFSFELLSILKGAFFVEC